MAGSVAVVQTSAVGIGVAVDAVATTNFQQVKLVAGQIGSTIPLEGTSAAPAAGAVGMVVREAGTVTVSGAVGVSGTVSVSGPVAGTVSISGVEPTSTVWFGGSMAVPVALHAFAEVTANIAGTANVRVSGTVHLIDMTATSGTNVAASSTGLIVVPKPGASVVASVSTVQTVGTLLGTLAVNVVAGGSQTTVVSGTLTVNTAATVAGASVTIQQGASVSAVVSGTVSVSGTAVVTLATGGTLATLLGTVAVNVVAGGAGGGSVTTAPPSISQSGQAMWIVGGQSTTAFPIWVSQINPPAGGGGSVTTAPPHISATGQMMFIVGGQSTTANPVVITGTVTAGAGTTVVSIQNIVGVVTAASVSVTGLPVWLNPTQAVNVGTVVTQLGTQIVSVVPGLSVSAVVSGTVAISIPVSQALGTIITQLGTQMVSIAQTSVSVAAVPTVNTVVTILGTQIVTIAQTSVSVAVIPVVNTVVTVLSTVNVAIVAGAGGGGSVTTTAPGITATGQVMWIVGGQSTTVSPVFVSVIGGNVVATTTQASGVTGALMYLAASQTVNLGAGGGLATTGVPGVSATAIIIRRVPDIVGTAIAFRYSTAVAGTALTCPIVTVAVDMTTVVTSAYVVPAGKELVLMAINGYVQNTAASVGFGRMDVRVVASTSFSATVGPVFGFLPLGNITSATVARAVGYQEFGGTGMGFPAGATVQFPVHVSGASSQPAEFVVMGMLIP